MNARRSTATSNRKKAKVRSLIDVDTSVATFSATPVFDFLRNILERIDSNSDETLADDDLTGTLRLLRLHACRDRKSALYRTLANEALEVVLDQIGDEVYSLVNGGDVARDESWPILLGHTALRSDTAKAPFLSKIIESSKVSESRAKAGLSPEHETIDVPSASLPKIGPCHEDPIIGPLSPPDSSTNAPAFDYEDPKSDGLFPPAEFELPENNESAPFVAGIEPGPYAKELIPESGIQDADASQPVSRRKKAKTTTTKRSKPAASSSRVQEVHEGPDSKSFFDAKSLTCLVCRKTYKKVATLKDHVNTHTGQYPYACPEADCEKSFQYKTSWERHKLWHDIKSAEPYQRRTGELAGDNVPTLTPEELQTLICATCNRKCRTEKTLMDHVNTHKGKRPYPCIYGCGASFAQKSTRRVHELYHQSRDVNISNSTRPSSVNGFTNKAGIPQVPRWRNSASRPSAPAQRGTRKKTTESNSRPRKRKRTSEESISSDEEELCEPVADLDDCDSMSSLSSLNSPSLDDQAMRMTEETIDPELLNI